MVRISRALDLPPRSFVSLCPTEPDAADGVQFERAGLKYQLVLNKRGAVRAAGAPCIFLWKLSDGHAQCGLGALRPLVCRAYPASLADGLLCAAGDACTCRRWSVSDLDPEADKAALHAVLEEAQRYSLAVDAWNAALPPPPAQRSFSEFCQFAFAAEDEYLAGQRGGSGGIDARP
ncbi:MAG TPA: hypothetical protein VET24_09575 [Actinomycetota bacterium]|nr:hypothetical protein [Actinomycetota bacterium]